VSKIFLDTNVLLYTLDQNDRERQTRARMIFRSIAENDTPVISTQILQEFYVASTSKLGVDALLAKSIVHSFEHMEVVQVDPHLIGEAIAAAESAKCSILCSEDLNHGQIIRGVRIENPFLP
jgi:predicted nucleic acid-binding protein